MRQTRIPTSRFRDSHLGLQAALEPLQPGKAPSVRGAASAYDRNRRPRRRTAGRRSLCGLISRRHLRPVFAANLLSTTSPSIRALVPCFLVSSSCFRDLAVGDDWPVRGTARRWGIRLRAGPPPGPQVHGIEPPHDCRSERQLCVASGTSGRRERCRFLVEVRQTAQAASLPGVSTWSSACPPRSSPLPPTGRRRSCGHRRAHIAVAGRRTEERGRLKRPPLLCSKSASDHQGVANRDRRSERVADRDGEAE